MSLCGPVLEDFENCRKVPCRGLGSVLRIVADFWAIFASLLLSRTTQNLDLKDVWSKLSDIWRKKIQNPWVQVSKNLKSLGTMFSEHSLFQVGYGILGKNIATTYPTK